MSTPSPARRKLGTPTLAMLPRVADSLSFLYLESVRIVQDDTGVCARVESPRGTERVYLPTAALACVLLGPGTSITQPAMATVARHGASLVCVGAGGVRSDAGIVPASLTTAWLERQAHAWADTGTRTEVASRMYTYRFGDTPAGATIAQLRGLEGQRVKAMYRILAQQHGIKRFRRNYDPNAWDTQDPVNRALSAANACIYGVVHAAVLAVGCSPALGFVHSGTQLAFVYDIADLFKMKTTVPLAFSLHASLDPDREARRALREEFRLLELMPEIVTAIQKVIDPKAAGDIPDRTADITHLWDPALGSLPSGVNYGSDLDPEF
ncbi:type I-E CRISPR-associated endonuclease Cas1 [Nocardia terpenica]|uniref:type I-E CRISPR-associated endonuclease Cas1e n=1 Tax=Nocardia terpenica TaxID=455432 RepID=UPI001895338C|nr:type I-E CRISPR-associated endonuclease Cas1e [Nocardia terpenica]MBF6063514.1 type I-E CRISPR-associated endonuclease Cas1 [Nocardia terpenica]MBF6106070.1 type I-E CRISPR-associated endonuclease Cas1 [Nocardia terpenica]MBF6113345.1 type I-E CRISPR-associated endonuclease Cas1 [Nocardia terpenica]MBF6119811.1 type I-E CRISPR-associated endonuclease Cas1 [Nocardia terpenica]MBF6152222.1 type I-E CRISPR-associated endonuclease Cas1 [Nocardia terpenica]